MDTKKYGFWRNKENWYKGNLHTHTTNSDGALSPEEMVAKYKEKKYDFLSITDHDKLTPVKNFSQADMLVISGEEIEISKYHILGIGINKFVDPVKTGNVQGVINEIIKQGGIFIVAHPYWSGLNITDLKNIKNYIGIEIYNTSCDYSIGKGFSLSHWDDLLLAGYHPFGFFTDDAHWHFNDHRPNDACQSWIMVKAKKLNEKSLIESIKEGKFYSSNGPIIKNVEVRNNKVYVRSSPVKMINFIAPRGSGERFTAIRTETICEAEYKIKIADTYVRIECIDFKGKYAVSNPIVFFTGENLNDITG